MRRSKKERASAGFAAIQRVARRMSLRVRDIVAADTPAILALNLESEAVLSPMDAARYAHLLAQSAYGRVVDEDGAVVAFLLAFREGADYDSVNYRWFDAQYEAFLYVDRVVVAQAHQGRGFGARLYDDLFAFARAGACVERDLRVRHRSAERSLAPIPRALRLRRSRHAGAAGRQARVVAARAGLTFVRRERSATLAAPFAARPAACALPSSPPP